MNLRTVVFHVVVAIAIVHNAPAAPLDNVPEPIQKSFDRFVGCVRNQQSRSIDGDFWVICGTHVHEPALNCLRSYRSLIAGKLEPAQFPGRTIYAFQLMCPSATGVGNISVLIERLKNGELRLSVHDPIP